MNEHGEPLSFSGKANGHDKKVVDGAQLLNDLVTYYHKYVRLLEDEYDVVATWVMHCHAFPAFNRTPYLSVSSPSLKFRLFPTFSAASVRCFLSVFSPTLDRHLSAISVAVAGH